MSLPAVKHVHFIGIGGYGMSALAQVLLQMGYRVTGSDLKSSALTLRLEEQGASIELQHSRGNIGSADLVVYSTAIPEENPELQETRARGIPLWHRSELLAALINSHYGIAVAGTHGKTTTTAMIALLLEGGGLDPTAIIGGVVSSFQGNARLGSGPYLVAEACESDHSFLRYTPKIAIVTNVEADHMEHYDNNYDRLQQAYLSFLNNLEPDGCAVLCFDDPYLRELAGTLQHEVVSYALDYNGAEPVDYSARQIELSGSGSTFVFCRHDEPVGNPIKLRVPGKHNVSNAVGALAVAAKLGVHIERCTHVLKNFTGAKRRFEIRGEANGIMVVDDYAHHPTEVKVTLQAAKATGRRICAIFQPHRYTRTAFFFEEFARAFRDADILLLHEVYPAGEKPIKGASSRSLARRIEENEEGPVFVSERKDDVADLALQHTRPGDMILIMGAGDINSLAEPLLQRLQEREAAVKGTASSEKLI